MELLIKANAMAIPLKNESVQCIITSPPYFGMRQYNVGDKQIGLEPTIQNYIENIRMVFKEIWRVMKSTGTAWLNLGDSYGNMNRMTQKKQSISHNDPYEGERRTIKDNPFGIREKSLMGIPWRVAFALQQDGWILRSSIIWQKPSCMPESVKDRPTRSHEYIFMLTKSIRYYYDYNASLEPSAYDGRKDTMMKGSAKYQDQEGKSNYGRAHERWPNRKPVEKNSAQAGTSIIGHSGYKKENGESVSDNLFMRNCRDVWSINPQQLKEAHYAPFPTEIPRRCIRLSTKPGDIVLDPFAGSGTTGRVAIELNRIPICIDLGYHDIVKRRLNKVQKELLV